MGIRLLLSVIAVWVIYWLIRRYFSRKVAKRESHSRAAVDMVRCLYCGTHLPKQDALIRQGEYYCCMDHVRAGQDND